jgi:hypothetical protein
VPLDQVVKVRVLAPQPSRARSPKRAFASWRLARRTQLEGPSRHRRAEPFVQDWRRPPLFKTDRSWGEGELLGSLQRPDQQYPAGISRRHRRQRLMRRPRARGAYGLRRDSHYSTDWGVVVEYDSSLGRTQGFIVRGFFLRPFGRFRPRASPDLVKRIDAAGGAVTPPTAYQGVSERPHEPGSNDSTRSRIAAVRIPISAALRRACCQICQHDLNTSESPGTR